MTFGQRLRRAREAKGLTRDQLAAASGVAYGTIHGYELGRRAPSLANAVRLAAALGLTCQDFAGCEDVAPKPPGGGRSGWARPGDAGQSDSEVVRISGMDRVMTHQPPTAAEWAVLRARLDQVIAGVRDAIDRLQQSDPPECDHVARTRDTLRRSLECLIHARDKLDQMGTWPALKTGDRPH